MQFLKSTGLIEYLSIVNVLIYIILVNLLGYISMYIDKRKAKYGRWRISEKTLIAIALLGGSIGSILGMKIFRHKTQKIKFFLGLPSILFFETLIITYFLVKY